MTLKISHQQLLDEANSQINAVAADEARKMHEDAAILFVDIRDIRELNREGTIPGAFHAPRGMLEFWVDPTCKYYKDVFTPGRKIVLFCNSGWRSALAAKSLQDMGMESVSHLKGGFTAWRKAEFPIFAIKPKQVAYE